MRIAMIGGGYVGLVSGACFAELGNDVAVVEADAGKLASLRAGRIPIYEPGLDTLVADNVRAGRLGFGAEIRQNGRLGGLEPSPPWHQRGRPGTR